MDWIERWFGLSPDGGDGSLEAWLISGLVVCAVGLGVLLSPPARGWARRALAAMQWHFPR
jgi:hypothetical protein